MWLPSRTFYNGHDLLPPSSIGKVQTATETPLRCLHRPHQSVRPGQQGRALQHPSENCCPPPPLRKTTQHDQVLPRWYEGNHPIWGQYGWAVWHQEQCETGLWPCTHPLRRFLLSAAEARLWDLNWTSVPTHQIRWTIVLPRQTESEDEGARDPQQRSALRWWRSSHLTHRTTTPVSHG